jgi:hypothetical protein
MSYRERNGGVYNIPNPQQTAAHTLTLYIVQRMRHLFQIGTLGPISPSIPAATRRYATCLPFFVKGTQRSNFANQSLILYIVELDIM